jgi:CubicO group peptidase (beta-lactamase class C family)
MTVWRSALLAALFMTTAAGEGLAACCPDWARPELAGMSGERLQRLDDWVRRSVAGGERAGVSVVVARAGRVVFATHHGYADLERRRPMAADTLVRIYSMTKPVTSVAIMMLVEQGRLQLTDPVARFLPELAELEVLERAADGTSRRVPARRAVTIQHLLTHTAGLSYVYPDEVGYRRDDLLGQQNTLADMIPRLARLPLLHQPGEGWNYGTATDVLARVVEVVSGSTIDEFLQRRLFEPLGMRDTTFRPSPAQRARLAEVYSPGSDGTLQRATDRAPRSGPWDGEGRFLAGGGGLLSTAPDYARFAQMLANGGELDGVRVLAPTSVALMLRNHVPEVYLPPRFAGPGGAELFAGHGFGLGFAVLADPVRHGAPGAVGLARWGGLAGTTFWVDPTHRLAVVYVSQHLPTEASRIERDLQALVYGALLDPAAR